MTDAWGDVGEDGEEDGENGWCCLGVVERGPGGSVEALVKRVHASRVKNWIAQLSVNAKTSCALSISPIQFKGK